MNEEKMFEQWKLWRNWIIEVLDRVTEEQADIIPEPHNNSIRWNAGHLLINIDGFVTGTLGIDSQLPAHYPGLFATGTSPSEWNGDVPSLDELKGAISEQPDVLRKHLEGKLDTPLKEPFMQMNTLGEALMFMIAHDAMHLSTIKDLRKLVKMK